MNLPSANLMVAILDHIVCVKISGRANFTSSLDLKNLVHELWGRGFRRFVIDLSECLTMDSTFLGVLSGIGLQLSGAMGDEPGQPLELLNPNPRISDVLENLGVVHLFTICQQAQANAHEHFEPLLPQPEQPSKVEVTRTCLEAHQLLMEINPENVRKFKDVTHFLADDLKKMESSE